MAKYLKDNFRPGDPLCSLSAGWMNWIGRFFNHTTWDGLVVKLTKSGRGCTIRTEGETETIELAEDILGSDLKELVFTDGRLTSVTDV